MSDKLYLVDDPRRIPGQDYDKLELAGRLPGENVYNTRVSCQSYLEEHYLERRAGREPCFTR
jgi:hypothetical protein